MELLSTASRASAHRSSAFAPDKKMVLYPAHAKISEAQPGNFTGVGRGVGAPGDGSVRKVCAGGRQVSGHLGGGAGVGDEEGAVRAQGRAAARLRQGPEQERSERLAADARGAGAVPGLLDEVLDLGGVHRVRGGNGVGNHQSGVPERQHCGGDAPPPAVRPSGFPSPVCLVGVGAAGSLGAGWRGRLGRYGRNGPERKSLPDRARARAIEVDVARSPVGRRGAKSRSTGRPSRCGWFDQSRRSDLRSSSSGMSMNSG